MNTAFLPSRKSNKKSREKRAELLRTEKRVIDGVEVDVKVYSAGTSGSTQLRDLRDVVATQRAAKVAARSEYTPTHELAYEGVPADHLAGLEASGNEVGKKRPNKKTIGVLC